MNIRRTISFVVTVLLVGIISYQFAWHPELRETIVDHPFQSIGLLTLLIAALAVLVWSVYDPNRWRTLLTFGLGMGTAIWFRELFGGIAWGQIGWILGSLALIVVLWFTTTWDEINGY